ncbi:MAG: hypothetical protein H7334_08025 [Ferruginibacter sp.]|nr:hypothetical protein [Ferruginibacter sp.]
MKNECKRVRRLPGYHSDGPMKLNMAIVWDGATKKPVKERGFLITAAVNEQPIKN